MAVSSEPALTPEVRTGLGAVGRIARALVRAVTLSDLAQDALEEMRDALELEVAALYIAPGGERPMLERFATAGAAERCPLERLVFDVEAWQFAVNSDSPLVMRDRGAWLMDHPFEPPADAWLVLPLGTGTERLGAVLAAASRPIAVTPTTGAVLRLLGDLLGAGIAAARLRQELQRTALERERMRLAAEVHDGLAQDLSLAMRELALQADDPGNEASRARLQAAVASAHETVRSRLTGMVVPAPLGGLRPALEDLCMRFAHRGLPVELVGDDRLPDVPPGVAAVAIRVLAEALANVERHAHAAHAALAAHAGHGRLELAVEDDGRGFDADSLPPEGHFGLLVMRERARAAGGELAISSAPGRGTRVTLALPLDVAPPVT
jgi:signal transduction histidine kinase